MRLKKVLSIAIAAACVAVTSAFAEPVDLNGSKSDKEFKQEEKLEIKDFKKVEDPVKALERKKEKIQSLLKEGKISKEKADALISKIDEKIKKIEEFNKLPLEQKKEKLISKFKSYTERKVKEGKLTREKADELIKDFTERIQKWDGKGYPDLGKYKCFKRWDKKK